MHTSSNHKNDHKAQAVAVDGVTTDDTGRIMRRREDVTEMLELARHLPDKQRLLIERKLRLGFSARQIARLTGLHTRTVQRNLRIAQHQLRDPVFIFVAQQRHRLPASMRSMATNHVLKQQPLRAVAAATGQTLHEVRKQASTLRAMVASHRVWSSIDHSPAENLRD